MGSNPVSSDDLVKKWIIGVLVAAPMLIWIAFVLIAGLADHSSTEPATVNETIQLAGVASGTALATIAGSFLGIKNTQHLSLGEAGRQFNLSINGWATVAYFAGLVIAILIWTFDPDRAYSADVIQTAFATFFGFALGALKAVTTSID